MIFRKLRRSCYEVDFGWKDGKLTTDRVCPITWNGQK